MRPILRLAGRRRRSPVGGAGLGGADHQDRGGEDRRGQHHHDQQPEHPDGPVVVSTSCQVSPTASRVAPPATVNHPAALLWKLVSCSRWVWVSFASMEWRSFLYHRRCSTYMTGGYQQPCPRERDPDDYAAHAPVPSRPADAVIGPAPPGPPRTRC